jgi:hypothetical protein
MRTWLRRTVLAVIIVMGASVVTPALADPPDDSCGVWERQVYAITETGGLVENDYCLDANRVVSRWVGHRVVATSGWADTATVFWSGQKYEQGAFYRVSASDGALHWSRDLVSWHQVAAFSNVDWRSFTSLMSSEPGVIHGTEKSGNVRRWYHDGWLTGADTWVDEGIVAVLPKASRLFGQAKDGFVGVDGTNANGVVSVWSTDFVRPHLRITVPSTVPSQQLVPFDLGNKYPTSAFGVTSAGRLAVMLPASCGKNTRTLRIDEETGTGFRLAFAGGYNHRGSTPVEWQCARPGIPPQ